MEVLWVWLGVYAMIGLLLLAHAVVYSELMRDLGRVSWAILSGMLVVIGPFMLGVLMAKWVVVMWQNPGRPARYSFNEACEWFRRGGWHGQDD